jgi:hypothetical protein
MTRNARCAARVGHGEISFELTREGNVPTHAQVPRDRQVPAGQARGLSHKLDTSSEGPATRAILEPE